DPQFVNLAAGDLHLQSSSPCVNMGNNSYAPGATDLEGNPRIVGANIDLGAYEYQAGGVAPFIVSQPVSRTALVGDNVTFKVSGFGTQPLTYQWRFNRTTISCATGSSLSLLSVQPGQAGNYSVTLSNALNSLTSSNAMLVVYATAESRVHFV